MYKRFNFTGKKKLSWKGNDRDLVIQLAQHEGENYELSILFNLDRFLEQHKNNLVYVTPYIGNASVVNFFGTVGEVNNEVKEINISDLSPISLIKLSVSVVDEKNNSVTIYADRVKPEEVVIDKKEQSKSQKLQSSLFNFKNTPLDVPYQVKCISGERPQVLCNSRINFKEKLSSSAYLQSIVMPSIFREVLIKYMFDEELEDEDWLENVFKFISENLTDEKYPDRVNGSFVKKSETLDWIEMVTDRFASKQKFVEVFNNYSES